LLAVKPTTMNVDCRAVNDAQHNGWALLSHGCDQQSVLDHGGRVQWAPGLHLHTVVIVRPRGERGAYIDPSHPHFRGVVHQSCLGLIVSPSPT